MHNWNKKVHQAEQLYFSAGFESQANVQNLFINPIYQSDYLSEYLSMCLSEYAICVSVGSVYGSFCGWGVSQGGRTSG